MARLHFDSDYAPCGFLIVKPWGKPYNDEHTILIQSDWDFPGVASRIGWKPCKCGRTDGTVPCPACGWEVSDMISEAYPYLRKRNGKSYPALNEYFD